MKYRDNSIFYHLTILTPRKEVPWMVGIMGLEVLPSLLTVVFSSNSLWFVNQLKALAAVDGCY
jgi:hypothetical protein